MDQSASRRSPGPPDRRGGPDWRHSTLVAAGIGALVVAALAVTVLVLGQRPEDVPVTEGPPPDDRVLYVAPWGSDRDEGSRQAPFATITRGLEELQAGDTLLIRGGTYTENVELTLAPGTPDAPIRITRFAGEQPVLRGLLWLEDLHHVLIDGLHVTWNDDNRSSQHMVKITGGRSWALRDSRLWGARSFAALLVASSHDGEPSDWLVSGNCIHDTHPTNRTNQDHLVYVNAPGSDGGVIEGNLLFNAHNGAAVKVGPDSERRPGTRNTVIRYNTIHNTSQGLLFAWDSGDNVAYGNILGEASHVQVRGFELTAGGNVVRDNAVYGPSTFIYNDEGYEEVTDFDNVFADDALFRDTDHCSGFAPEDADIGAWGHYTRG